jgi:hypothetical protein
MLQELSLPTQLFFFSRKVYAPYSHRITSRAHPPHMHAPLYTQPHTHMRAHTHADLKPSRATSHKRTCGRESTICKRAALRHELGSELHVRGSREAQDC